jgi:hypothetical protein
MKFWSKRIATATQHRIEEEVLLAALPEQYTLNGCEAPGFQFSQHGKASTSYWALHL